MPIFAITILIITTFLGVDAMARIGESAQESRIRYGEDETLSDIKEIYDQTEVKHLLLKEDFKKMENEVVTLKVGETTVGLGERPTITIRQRDVYIKTLMGLRDNPPQFLLEGKAINKKSDFEQQVYFHANKKNIQEYFGKSVDNIMEFELLYTAIEKCLIDIEQHPPSWFLQYKQLKYSEERLAKLKEEIKNYESSLQKISNGEASGYQTMTFKKSGFKIYAYLYNNKTYKMIFLSEEIGENDVLAILQNNSDGSSNWQSQRPPQPIDETNWKVLMEYYTMDDKLHGELWSILCDL